MSAVARAVSGAWPLAADALSHAIERVRPYLDPGMPVGERLRNLWLALSPLANWPQPT
jgi:hypothetical protein